jgi:LPXTG-motif cell wall-anchored protein
MNDDISTTLETLMPEDIGQTVGVPTDAYPGLASTGLDPVGQVILGLALILAGAFIVHRFRRGAHG